MQRLFKALVASVVSNWLLVISFRFLVDIPDIPMALGAKDRLNIAGEEPILWSGSVAENLDPSGTASEETLMQALRKAHLGFHGGPDETEVTGGRVVRVTRQTFGESHGMYKTNFSSLDV